MEEQVPLNCHKSALRETGFTELSQVYTGTGITELSQVYMEKGQVSLNFTSLHREKLVPLNCHKSTLCGTCMVTELSQVYTGRDWYH